MQELLCKLSKRDRELPLRRGYTFRQIKLLSFLESDENALRMPSRLRYFREPKLKNYPLDLTDGLDFYTFRHTKQPNEVHQKLERYLMTIWSQCDDGIDEQQLKNIQIYTNRQTLQKLMLTPYRQKKNWSVIATKFDGRIFINLLHENVYDFNVSKTVRQAFHNKFDAYCFSDSPHTTPMSDDPIDENNQLYAILHVKLHNIEILYTADVPGVTNKRKIKNLLSKRELTQCRFVLTKVLRPMPVWRRRPWTLDWAAQAYLSCCSMFCIGFYDVNGLITKPIEHHTLRSVIEEQSWNLRVCLNFLQRILKKIMLVMSNVDSTKIVYEFTFNPAELSISHQRHKAKDIYACVSKEFIKFVKSFKV